MTEADLLAMGFRWYAGNPNLHPRRWLAVQFLNYRDHGSSLTLYAVPDATAGFWFALGNSAAAEIKEEWHQALLPTSMTADRLAQLISALRA